MADAQGHGRLAALSIAPLMMLSAALIAPAQTFTKLADLNGTDAANPEAALAQGIDGSLYGTGAIGGSSRLCSHGCGAIFKVTPSGTVSNVYSFDFKQGASPDAALILGPDQNFYGTTSGGGASEFGTVFKLSQEGQLTTLANLDSATTGGFPFSGLVLGADGNFYGTTGGQYDGPNNDGTVYSMTPGGKLTLLYSFNWCHTGADPLDALIQGPDGAFYGTSEYGGTLPNCSGAGTIFKISATGTLSVLYTFDLTDGGYPSGSLLQGEDGAFYGTTSQGGEYNAGTVFKIVPGGRAITLHNFGSTGDGVGPQAGLVRATDGNLYGTTYFGGAYAYGTIFGITPDGDETVLHSFDRIDGMFVLAGLIQATNGILYGAANSGGASGDGTIFSLSLGLGPFVKAVPALGHVGRSVIILGNDLQGASLVTFNGTPAEFTVNAGGTAIETSVPEGATSGKIEVATSSGTLVSNESFRVIP
ncbi:MAG TPA: choice-of-anchor tandem repeat GloVer-containing protein [Terriglobia bacterium]|jgi:uncharacterized repeat protein (TIGR03803 family)|nr:choice-of-anchor tandem repeat GloVer-containing protein [Terriglobia bacterium]